MIQSVLLTFSFNKPYVLSEGECTLRKVYEEIGGREATSSILGKGVASFAFQFGLSGIPFESRLILLWIVIRRNSLFE